MRRVVGLAQVVGIPVVVRVVIGSALHRVSGMGGLVVELR